MTDHSDDFVNGDDIHFQYADNVTHLANRNISSRPLRATLNNPDEDYPTSRVIKQSPNGDVVVESMVEEMFSSHPAPGLDSPRSKSSQHILDVQSSLWNNASLEEQENLKNFWESLDDEHKIRLVKIDKKPIMDLFKSEARSLHLDQLPLIPPQSSGYRHGYPSHHSNPYSHRHPNPSANDTSSNFAAKPSPQDSCTCKYCGRRSAVIEDELESIYDTHFDDILEFIHEVRDINDLNALPGLLFGGFHLLDAEHKLQKRLSTHHSNHTHLPHPRPPPAVHGNMVAPQILKSSSQTSNSLPKAVNGPVPAPVPAHVADDCTVAPANDVASKTSTWLSTRPLAEQKFLQSELLKIAKVCADVNDSVATKPDANQKSSAVPENDNASISHASKLVQSYDEQKIFNTLLDPKLFKVLENMDIDRLKKMTSSNGGQDSVILNTLVEIAGSLRDTIRDLHDADKMLIDKAMAVLRNMGHIFSANGALNPDSTAEKQASEPTPVNLANQLSHGLLTFAQDLLKNDGRYFVSMMEALSDPRKMREGKSTQIEHVEPAWVDEDDKELASCAETIGPDPHLHRDMPAYNEVYGNRAPGLADEGAKFVQEIDQAIEDDLDHEYEDEEDDDREEDDEDEEEDDREEGIDELFDEHTTAEGYDQDDAFSDTESEISEEEKMQEIRRLFLIQVIKLFQARLKKAYQEKLSQDRTQMLILELEAEENAKKERELKKLKQKEKLKEKKRLQQLAKEEERQKKEQEQLAKQEADRAKLEALRLDQKRRKEEQRLKREEEKKKRIEELKRKEEEHQKKIEAQRKREEEAKKTKEERKKRAEEERKRKEEEKKVKDALKLERDREREQQRLDRERGELFIHVQGAHVEHSPEVFAESAPFSSGGPEHLSLNSMLPSQLANTLTNDYDGSYPQYSNQVTSQNDASASHQVSVPMPSHPTAPISLSTKSPSMAQTLQLTSEPLIYGSGLHHAKSQTMSQPIQRGNSFANSLPWASLAVLANANAVTSTPPGLFSTPFATNNFSPFHAPPSNESSDFYAQGPPGSGAGGIMPQQEHLMTGATANAMPPSNASPHGGWSQRKSSIWNQPSLGMNTAQPQVAMLGPTHGSPNVISQQLLWSSSPLSAAHALPNAYLPPSADFPRPASNTPSVSGSISASVSASASASASATVSASGKMTGDTSHELLQKAAYAAFMHLQSLQQLDFGSAPLHKLYAIVPQMAGQPNVPLQQLLNALRAPSVYPFELVHDDFGTVTHVKMGYARANLGHGSSILGNSAPLQPYAQASPLSQRHPMHATSALSIIPMSGQRMAPISDQVMADSLMRSFDQINVDDTDLTASGLSQRSGEPLLGADQSTASYMSNRGLWN